MRVCKYYRYAGRFGHRLRNKDAADVVRYHHEKFDGTGYEAGLRGYDIPINARIFAVADVFDALTSRRLYKEPFTLEEAMRILTEGRGGHFDPALVDSFTGIAGSLYEEINGTGGLSGLSGSRQALRPPRRDALWR